MSWPNIRKSYFFSTINDEDAIESAHQENREHLILHTLLCRAGSPEGEANVKRLLFSQSLWYPTHRDNTE